MNEAVDAVPHNASHQKYGMSSIDSYRIKHVRFFGRKVPILCQNENGPCPLLAIANILLLQRNISIHPDLSEISFNELTQLVAGFLLDSNPPQEDTRVNFNQQTQLDAVIKLLPRLQFGLDVNVRFNSVHGFEFTEEMAAFDMTGITLLHGWILDPADKRTGRVIEGISYNQLVEKLLEFRSAVAAVGASEESKFDVDTQRVGSTIESDVARSKGNQQGGSTHVQSTAEEGDVAPTRALRNDHSTVGASANDRPPASVLHRKRQESDNDVANRSVFKEGHVAEEFFRETASQLTYYGLSQLHQEVRERQLCVFFRNNHFSTMFKYEGKLYLLITDLGYARESSVVWEKLDQIDGNTEYADSDFVRSSRCNFVSGEHTDEDYMLALALQQEDAAALVHNPSAQSVRMGDEAVAMALLGEEQAMLEQQTGGGVDDATFAGVPIREDRDRQRPAEGGSSCSIQ